MAPKLFRPDPQMRPLPKTGMEQRILALFQTRPVLSVVAINNAIKPLSPECVAASLRTMTQQNRLTRFIDQGRAFYQLPTEGVDHV